MYMNTLPACVPGACLRKSEMVLDHLKLMLQMVVSHHKGARNGTLVLWDEQGREGEGGGGREWGERERDMLGEFLRG